MTRKQFDNIAPGAGVTVYAFGVHAGVVIGKAPTVTIQGRTFVAHDWLSVRVPGKPDYHGTFRDVDVTPRIARRRAK